MSLFNQFRIMKAFVALSIVINLVIIQNIFSQELSRYLEIRGNAELKMKPVSKATIDLYEGSKKIKTVQTGSGGSFSFKLEMNKDYTVAVSKKGYVQKKIKFNTKIPDEQLGIWVREFAIGLVEYCEGVDYSVLDEPVDVIKYSVRKKDFESDKTFVYKMKSRLENLMIDIDQCHVDKYEDLLDKADKLYKEKSYEEARKEYQAAQEIFPEERYPANQISKISTNIGKEKNIDGCHQCDDFPCKFVNNFPIPVGKKVILRAIPYWRAHGTEQWIVSEEKRYTCPECGEKLFRGAQQCRHCKSAVDVD